MVARQLLRPVKSLADAMRSAKENGVQVRVDHVSSEDELSQLATLFNSLMDRVEASFRQQQQFVEDASHELKTPIAIMEGHLSMLERWGRATRPYWTSRFARLLSRS
ncbi:HAMP domain-containing protein [Paenibacillus sp. P26]|nr:HAMP domain-containing protein [Paenibacillus sp. P26]